MLFIASFYSFFTMPRSPKHSCCKHRKLHHRNDDNEIGSSHVTYLTMFTLFTTLILHHILSLSKGRGPDLLHRVRKDLNGDIIASLGKKGFQRAYCMKVESFLHLHDLLKKDLEKQFFLQSGAVETFVQAHISYRLKCTSHGRAYQHMALANQMLMIHRTTMHLDAYMHGPPNKAAS